MTETRERSGADGACMDIEAALDVGASLHE